MADFTKIKDDLEVIIRHRALDSAWFAVSGLFPSLSQRYFHSFAQTTSLLVGYHCKGTLARTGFRVIFGFQNDALQVDYGAGNRPYHVPESFHQK